MSFTGSRGCKSPSACGTVGSSQRAAAAQHRAWRGWQEPACSIPEPGLREELADGGAMSSWTRPLPRAAWHGVLSPLPGLSITSWHLASPFGPRAHSLAQGGLTPASPRAAAGTSQVLHIGVPDAPSQPRAPPTLCPTVEQERPGWDPERRDHGCLSHEQRGTKGTLCVTGPSSCAFAPGAEGCAVGGMRHQQIQGVGSRVCWPFEK